jgi:hypothetical protein
LCNIKDERPGEGVKAEDISRKEVHEIPHKEGQDSTRDQGVRKTQVEGKDQDDIRSDPLNGE